MQFFPSSQSVPSQNKLVQSENIQENIQESNFTISPPIETSVKLIEITKSDASIEKDSIKIESQLLIPSSFSPSELILSLEEPKKKGSKFEYYIGLFGLILLGILLLFFKGKFGSTRIYNIILLLASIGVLIGASNLVLENAVKLAELIGISEIIIGLTLVSIGTSIPEIFTSILASQHNAGAIAIGDIYGSYISQLTLFLGIVMLIIPGTVERAFIPHVRRDAGLMIFALLFLSFHLIDGVLSRIEAIISIGLFFLYSIYLFIDAKKNPVHSEEKLYSTLETEKSMGIHPDETIFQSIPQEIPSKGKNKFIRISFYLILLSIGIAFSYLGAYYTVDSGSIIARSFNVSEHIIGATIVGFGTGLPELVVSVSAARKNKPDIAYGNLLGSNIVDPLFSSSLGALVAPIVLNNASKRGILSVSLPIALIIGIYVIVVFRRKETSEKLGRIFGSILIFMYVCFLAVSFIIN